MPEPPAALAASLMRGVRDRFRAIGWTEAASAARLGIRSLAALLAVRPLGASALDPVGLLCRVFLLDEAVPRDALAALLSVRVLDRLERMNLLELRERSVVSSLNLFPCGDLYLATDKRGLHPELNQVMWLYPESWQLAKLASKRPIRRALDLCTGSGIQALLARSFADEVVAVDTNPRAIAFAELNRLFNGVERVTFLQGDLYRPLEALPRAHRRFGAILANPPYHPVLDSKPGENAYSGGESGEEVFRGIVRGLRAHLRPGGTCQIITLFVDRRGVRWKTKLGSWLAGGGTGFDVVRMSTPVEYPSDLQRELVRLGRQRRKDIEKSFEAQRITGFSFGLASFERVRGRGVYVEAPYRPPP